MRSTKRKSIGSRFTLPPAGTDPQAFAQNAERLSCKAWRTALVLLASLFRMLRL